MDTWAHGRERAAAVRPRRGAQEHPQGTAVIAVAVSPATQHRAPRSGPGVGGDDRALLHATARVAVETARNVRMLTAIAVRTVSVPDTAAFGAQMRGLAEQPRTYSEHESAYVWAQLVLIAPAAVAVDSGEVGHVPVRAHAAQCTQPEVLRDFLQECIVTRMLLWRCQQCSLGSERRACSGCSGGMSHVDHRRRHLALWSGSEKLG